MTTGTWFQSPAESCQEMYSSELKVENVYKSPSLVSSHKKTHLSDSVFSLCPRSEDRGSVQAIGSSPAHQGRSETL